MIATRPRILNVDDEPQILRFLVHALSASGHDTVTAMTAAQAEVQVAAARPDLVILDLGLPDADALTWLESHPIDHAGLIICSARGHPQERIAGMQSGADAYLVKPVQLEELSLLAQKLLHRVLAPAHNTWTLDKIHWTLAAPSGRKLKLTHSEAQVIQMLAQSPGAAVPKNDIVIALGHQPATYDMRRMEILIRRLRNKAKEQLGTELPLETAHRLGYAFTAPVEAR